MTGSSLPTQRPTREDALRLARRKYLTGERIDMRQLAAELGINRVTLYRWVGDGDALLVETMWALTETTLSEEWEKVRRRKGPRVAALVGGYLRAVVLQPGAQKFALENNERVMRLMTLTQHGYQPRFVAAIGTYLAKDIESGRIHSPLSLDDLAYATVRIAESYYYLPTITGQPPNPEGAERVISALLRP